MDVASEPRRRDRWPDEPPRVDADDASPRGRYFSRSRPTGEVGEGLTEQAFRGHYGQIYRYLRRRTGDADDAEELTQEVFADAAVTIARMSSPPGSVLALLYTIAGRRFADYARHESHVVHAVPLDEIDDLSSDVPSAAYGLEVAHAIHEQIGRLEAEQRLVLGMKLLEGCSFREIAGVVGSTEAAAKMRFQRALGLLRHELELQGIEP